ncbi:DUF262 domain-containing protein [Ornithinimicrobium cerasi]|uniref:DUF262 domain-containing protein n=1 Tax=Ornithinimicrobium cerasi TaxID=2248773 RepID=UPI000EFE9614|nr:DUF262 domain-containing protein [Ornithinimicrobium cerasi]
MVSAKQTRFTAVLSGKYQLRVPLYQRRYAWKRDAWTALWGDVLHLALDQQTDPAARHFLGSVVLAPTPNGAPHARLVIDGQQRLLTTSLLLCALRDSEPRLPAALRTRVERCLLVPRGRGGPLKRLKLLPTQFDQNAFSRVVHQQELEPGHEASKAYQFFQRRLVSMQQGQDENVEGVTTAEVVRVVLDGLECVSVVAQASDNVHRIFESLNNRGQPLTQADLIRNYVFMRLSSNAEDFHEYTWKPLEERFSADELTQLFWLDLVRDRPTITQRQTYVEQQKKLHKVSTTGLKKAIDEVVHAGALWDRILRPEGEPSKPVRNRLERLKEWKTTTVWPVLMFLLEERDRGTATSPEIARAMQYLESYFVRRVVIGRATDNMNRVLLAAPQSVRDSDDPVDLALRRYLSGENKHWATDDELRREVGTKAFYNHGKAFQKTLILSWLELELAGGEYVLADDFTVEHVMPQTPTAAWRAEVRSGAAPGENVDLLYSGLVNTLGNLTLARSGRNSQMGNKSFADKKAVLAKHGSGLQMTKEITKKHHWRPDDIRKRSAVMVERIIKTWPGPLEG